MFYELSGPQIEQRKNKIIKIFKDCSLSITVTTNVTSVVFLDLTLNLKTESHQPFRKPSNGPTFIDINSNHPLRKLKQLPKSISKRLSKNSPSNDVFDKSKAPYEKYLNNSGFHENLIYHQDAETKMNMKRSSNADAK